MPIVDCDVFVLALGSGKDKKFDQIVAHVIVRATATAIAVSEVLIPHNHEFLTGSMVGCDFQYVDKISAIFHVCVQRPQSVGSDFAMNNESDANQRRTRFPRSAAIDC
jgi:hypothetical protein